MEEKEQEQNLQEYANSIFNCFTDGEKDEFVKFVKDFSFLVDGSGSSDPEISERCKVYLAKKIKNFQAKFKESFEKMDSI